ncbi:MULTISPECIES: glycoside hydrolase family 32 protein [unclassified Saccharicrinis]|uniref:glycoside hydrolase family 32 protein n=1 Tax=unclassified Saccharicrinis TaxID=2646859 RepID=UPI003D32AEF6
MKLREILIAIIAVGILLACSQKKQQATKETASEYYTEQYRPQYHFTPDSMWMNDPNGMVYYQGEYHLFYQYYPDANVWGPMHWGHAVSTDLVHWEHLPIGIYPDSLGWIFSGSAVVDWNNTSGLGSEENPPLIAIFTHHNDPMAKQERNDYQYQSIAYSLDKGRTWETYQGNPVLANPGIQDFRDPKVIWSEKYNKWIMALAVKDHIGFYSSPDLKSWTHESDFGKDVGGHGGVWECPDLFPIKDDRGNEKWVLLVSINPGGPNGGSATQYFVGEFDGNKFINENPSPQPIWLDHGKDNYAGVTWSDIPEQDGRRIFIGWMSNWQYATKVPTERWRSGMTLPRELRLISKGDNYLLAAKPVAETASILNKTQAQSESGINLSENALQLFESKVKGGAWMSELNIDAMSGKSVNIKLKNDLKEEVSLNLEIEEGRIDFDRTKAGKSDFSQDFAVPVSGNYVFDKTKIKVHIYWDENGFEIFVNDGEFQMTNLVFPNKNWNTMEMSSSGEAMLIEASFTPVHKIWN